MKLTTKAAQLLLIEDVPGLDPIRVITEDLSPGRGRIIVVCYSRAWSASWCAFWGAMGEHDVRSFVCSVGAGYVCDNMMEGSPLKHGGKKRQREETYLKRIIEAVQHALRPGTEKVGKPLPHGRLPGVPWDKTGCHYAPDGTLMNADCTRSIFDDVDE